MSTIPSPGRADLLRSNEVSTARTAYEQQARSAGQARPQISTEKGDRVSISQEARALAINEESEDVAFARLALRASQSANSERMGEIRARLADGFYTSAATHEQIAQSVASELAAAVI